MRNLLTEKGYASLGICIAVGASIVGCGSGSHPVNKSQVLAKINNREITILQLNQSLQAIDPEKLTPEVTKKALDSLVDEELLVQEAEKQKLDRDPTVVLAIEHARRQVLAQSFSARRIFPRTPPSLTEEESFYKENPGLFEHRKLYRLAVYTIKSADMTNLLKADLDTVDSADQLRNVLDRHAIRYEVQLTSPAAEELPLSKLNQFAAAKVGDVLTAQAPQDQELLISIVGFEDRPLSFEQAKPLIAQYLAKSRNAEAMEEHLKAQRATASIAYFGDFAKNQSQSAK